MNRLYIVHIKEPVDSELGYYIRQVYVSAADARYAAKHAAERPERVFKVVIDGNGEHVAEELWK